MKIAILGTRGIPSGYSGYEAFAEEVGRRMADLGHEVVIYAHSNMFREKISVYKGVRLVYMQSLKGKNTSQFSHSLISTLHLITRERADVALFCNAANGPFGLLLKAGGIKSAINVDGLEWLRPKWSNLAKKYFKFGAYCSTRLFDQVVTDAKGMQEIYAKEFGCKSVDIAYGADIKYSQSPSLLDQFGIRPYDYFLIASRLVPDNNADLIVRAFLRSRSERKLVIAGGTAYKNPFEDHLRGIGDERVIFLGHIDSSEIIKELHCNAFAYVHGHQFGGTNPALLKSLAYGNCVLALDTVFNREVLADGKYGILFEKNEEDLAEKINFIEAHEDVAEKFRKSARTRIQENYTWEKITQQYLHLFKLLLEKDHRSNL